MQHSDLPERWLRELERYTDAKYGSDYKYRGRLSTSDFGGAHSLKLTFCDGSTALFRYSFAIEMPSRNEVMLFTEHCGYHLFSSVDLLIEEVDHPQDQWLED